MCALRLQWQWRGLKERFGEDGLKKIEETGQLEVPDPLGSYCVTKANIQERLRISMREQASSVPPSCRVLTIHGSADQTIPVEDALQFDQVTWNHQLQVLEGANHNFNKHKSELAAIVTDFLTGGKF
eukprot:TRINITY_DN8149_c0_g1_i3.p3 TRINITY_DN8149_c0_g1~~TRINITY_DN8149_c0_g1_i3.p3  ORF type:complete len:127 (+),score=27.36 TRINITY_DN8149_c0_g1_i3:397-777(+)